MTPIKNQYFITCPKYLEELLQQEVKTLIDTDAEIVTGGVQVNCSLKKIIEFILKTKLASRVLYQLCEFDIKKEKDIYFEASKFLWHKVFTGTPLPTFKITTHLSPSPKTKKYSQFKNTLYLSRVLKDALVDSLRNKLNTRPDVDLETPDLSIHMHLTPHDNIYASKNRTVISIDMCQQLLSDRNLRTFTKAPLRENLAQALWQTIKNKNETPIEVVKDGMTGSGTFLWEAIMDLANLPGSYFKLKKHSLHLAFEHHFYFTRDKTIQSHYQNLVDSILVEGKKQLSELQTKGIKFEGFDSNKGAIDHLQREIEELELEGLITLKNYDFFEISNQQKNTILFLNPPYGERLESDSLEDIGDFYHDIGEKLKKDFKNAKAYIFTGNLPAIKRISLRSKSRTPFFNGTLDCRLVEYDLY